MLRRGSSLILILAFLSVYGMGCASERGDEASTSRGPQSAGSPSESDSALSDSLFAGAEDDDLAEIRPAPPYSVGTGNNRFRLADHRGSVVVLNFWATWNQASVEGMDAMSSIHEELSPEGVVVVGIMQDEGGQTALDAWEAEHDVAYPLYPDPHHSASSVFGDMEFLPVTVIVDREGMIRERHTGKLTEDELLDLLGPILIEADEPLADSTLPADTAEVLAIRPTQVPDLIADGAMLIDLRPNEERDTSGVVPVAEHKPLAELTATDLPANYAVPIIFLGTSDATLTAAIERTLSWGYTRVYRVEGGTEAWRAAGLPFEVAPPQNQPVPRVPAQAVRTAIG